MRCGKGAGRISVYRPIRNKRENKRDGSQEAVSLETVLKDCNNYILVNPSGMGKTTFLIHAACAHLDRARNYPFVPIFTTCIVLNNREGSIENFITAQVELLYKNSQTAIVDEEWQNLYVLIDVLGQARDLDDISCSHTTPSSGWKKTKKKN